MGYVECGGLAAQLKQGSESVFDPQIFTMSQRIARKRMGQCEHDSQQPTRHPRRPIRSETGSQGAYVACSDTDRWSRPVDYRHGLSRPIAVFADGEKGVFEGFDRCLAQRLGDHSDNRLQISRPVVSRGPRDGLQMHLAACTTRLSSSRSAIF